MTFNPDKELVTHEDYNDYVQWCAATLVSIVDETDETESSGSAAVYAVAMQAAKCLWVVAQAQIHLADDVDEAELHRARLGAMFEKARAFQRANEDIGFNDLLSARVALDCFRPVGKHAGCLLRAASAAIEALELIFIYPLADKWGLPAPGPWALVVLGRMLLGQIEDDPDPLTYQDFSVAPISDAIGKLTWDAAVRTSQSVGAFPPSPN